MSLMASKEVPHPERLSVRSSGLPWFAVSEDGIEDDDELSHAGGERLLAGFSGGTELDVVGRDGGIGAACGQGRDKQSGAHGRAAAGERAAAAHRPVYDGDRRHPDASGG